MAGRLQLTCEDPHTVYIWVLDMGATACTALSIQPAVTPCTQHVCATPVAFLKTATYCLQVEEYGAQPPIELLRQWMDHGGWYDRKDLTFKHLDVMQFVAAMGPPGGGRNSVTNRYLRHFSVVSITAFDRDNLQLIFTALVDWWLRKYSYGQNISRLAKPLVAATLDVYEGVQAQLLPTPAKSHYTFNLRDVSKVFQVRVWSKREWRLLGTLDQSLSMLPACTSWQYRLHYAVHCCCMLGAGLASHQGTSQHCLCSYCCSEHYF